jgi:hypothetical protein
MQDKEAEVPLSPGMAFMANPNSYKPISTLEKKLHQVNGICSYACQLLEVK